MISIFHPPSFIVYLLRVRWNKITVVGVGLLGGSLGLAIKQRRLAKTIVGFVRRAASVVECQKLGAVDHATQDLRNAVADADLIVLCTPIAQMRARVDEMLPSLKRGAIVTDVGSVKACVVRELERVVARAGGHFIGSHPMAGAEKTGVAAARDDLFVNAVCVVTPTRKSNKTAARRVEELWRAVGGRTLRLAPGLHDALVSRSSHLPHIVASVLTNHVLNPKRPKQQASLCATGFCDTTRIASGSPEMWRDIALGNRVQLRAALDGFVRELQLVQAILRRGDSAEITRFLETAKERRDRWRAGTASPSPE